MKLKWTGPSRTIRRMSADDWEAAGLAGEAPMELVCDIGMTDAQLTVEVSEPAGAVLLRSEPDNWKEVESEPDNAGFVGEVAADDELEDNGGEA